MQNYAVFSQIWEIAEMYNLDPVIKSEYICIHYYTQKGKNDIEVYKQSQTKMLMILAYLDERDSPINTSFNDLTGKRCGSDI